MALMLQKKRVVEYLLPQEDLDLNTKATDGTTALMTACDQQVRRRLFAAAGMRYVTGVQTNECGACPHAPVWLQVPLDWIQAMLERGANRSINDEDNEGRSALDRCEKGSPGEISPKESLTFPIALKIVAVQACRRLIVWTNFLPFLNAVYELLIKYGATPRPEKPPTPPPEPVQVSEEPEKAVSTSIRP
ncbi:hypothetical protein ACSSS7_006282 [Eimeria intestinalis]